MKFVTIILFCLLYYSINVYSQLDLFYINPGIGIESISLDDNSIKEINKWEENKSRCLTLDKKHNKIYWTDVIGDQIKRSNFDGTNEEVIINKNLILPEGIAIDTVNDYLFWLDNGTKSISRSTIDGKETKTLISYNLINLNRIKVDAQNGKIYWTEWGNGAPFGKISRANFDGSGIEELVKIKDAFLQGLALDIKGGKMYWTDSGYNKIQRSNLDGTNIQDLITKGLSAPNSIDIDLTNGYIYWSEIGNRVIMKADIMGNNITKIVARKIESPQDIAINEKKLLLFSNFDNEISYNFFPNPVSDESITIKGFKDGDVATIIDLTGKAILKTKIEEINTSILPQGQYILTINNFSKNKNASFRFTKL
jgi:sugar lactone lactonase YvrE